MPGYVSICGVPLIRGDLIRQPDSEEFDTLFYAPQTDIPGLIDSPGYHSYPILQKVDDEIHMGLLYKDPDLIHGMQYVGIGEAWFDFVDARTTYRIFGRKCHALTTKMEKEAWRKIASLFNTHLNKEVTRVRIA